MPWVTLLHYTAGEVRRFAAAQARRLLAIAAVLDGASREEAARIGGMDRQTLRDWVIRFNEQGPDGLINIPSPGMPPKLKAMHKAFLARIVEEGPTDRPNGQSPKSYIQTMRCCIGLRPPAQGALEARPRSDSRFHIMTTFIRADLASEVRSRVDAWRRTTR